MMAQERTRGNERDPNPSSPRCTISTILVKGFRSVFAEYVLENGGHGKYGQFGNCSHRS